MAHRVSLWTRFPNEINSGLCSLHRCDNPQCCNPDHLFVGTHKDNVHDMINKGRRVKLFGDDHPGRKHPENLKRGEESGSAKLTQSQVIEIRTLFAGGVSIEELASRFPCCADNIRAIVTRRSWRHVP